MDSGFQVLDSSFCEWNLDSGFQSLVGLRIPCVIFRIPKPKIPDSTSKTFPISDSTSIYFPDSGIPYMNRHSVSLLGPILSVNQVLKNGRSRWKMLPMIFWKPYLSGWRKCIIPESTKKFPEFGIRIPRHGTKSRRSLHFVVVYVWPWYCLGDRDLVYPKNSEGYSYWSRGKKDWFNSL